MNRQPKASELIEAWRRTLVGPHKSWVLFAHGTCVVLPAPAGDLAEQARALLGEWGPVHVASRFADFGTVTLDNGLGWAVTCHHNDIITFVSLDEVPPGSEDVEIGLFGRSKRACDAEELQVIHVEDRRSD